MNVKEIIAKLLKKEDLSNEEKSFLESELTPKKEDKKELQALQSELTKYKQQLEEIETAKLSDLEKKQKEIEKLQEKIKERDTTINSITSERDTANSTINTMKRKQAISAISKEHKFSDDDYLDMLLNNGNIELDKTDSVKAFMEKLKTEKPNFFSAEVVTGSPKAPPPKPKDIDIDHKTKVGGIIELLNNAPEIK